MRLEFWGFVRPGHSKRVQLLMNRPGGGVHEDKWGGAQEGLGWVTGGAAGKSYGLPSCGFCHSQMAVSI